MPPPSASEIHGRKIDLPTARLYDLFTMETATPPPIDPVQIPGRPVKWPKILGIIALVLGILGILQCALSPLSLLFVDNQMEFARQTGGNDEVIAEYMAQLKSVALSSSIAIGVVAIILLVGGILLLRKRPSAPLVLQIWSVLKILVGGYFSFRSLSLTRLQMEMMMGQSGTGGMTGGREMEMIQRVTDYAVYGGMIFGLLWIAALPVFFLIWFAREPVKEEVSTWRN